MKFISQITILLVIVALGESFVPPRVNPPSCATVKCHAGTKCIIKFGKVFCLPEDICHLPPEPGLCRAYFPRYFYNMTSEKCERFIYGGCGGNKNNFAKKEECEAKCEKGPCPPDKPQHFCLIRPCLLAKCPAYPNAKCVDNYCGGCFADFYLNGRKVECRKVVDPCGTVKCRAGTRCVVKYGKAFCLPETVNPCGVKLCRAGTICFPNKRKARCIPLSASCAAVTCLTGHRCVVRNGKAACEPACKSNSDCKQQGSFCNKKSGVCKCRRFCRRRILVQSSPVCGSDGKQYGSLCKLNAAACHRKTTINPVPCKDISTPPCHPSKLFNCFIRPCQFAQCPAHPGAKCVDNYCGCVADFYVGGRKVDCKLHIKREDIN